MAAQSLVLCRDPRVLGVLEPILNDLGIAAEVCSNRLEAMSVLGAHKFNPVIVDCDDIEGAPELLRSVREFSRNSDSIALSIINGSLGLRDAFDMGANLVLRKPLCEREARQVVRTAWALVTRMRRRFLRHVVHTLHYVELDGMAETPMLLDIGEGGFSVQALEPVHRHQGFLARFTLPGEPEELCALAAVAWTDSSGRVGLRFTGMPTATRERLKAWLANHAEAGPPEAPNLIPWPESSPEPVQFPLRLAPTARQVLSTILDVLIVLAAVGIFGGICIAVIGVVPDIELTASGALLLASLGWLLYRHLFFGRAKQTPGVELARLFSSRLNWRQERSAHTFINLH